MKQVDMYTSLYVFKIFVIPSGGLTTLMLLIVSNKDA